jgi:hypothetical protein
MNSPRAVAVSAAYRILPGAPLPAVHPGDLILVRGETWVSRAVFIAQAGRPWRRTPARYRHWTHVALVTHRSGRIIEVLRGGISLQHLNKYQRVELHVVRLSMSDDARVRLARAAHGAVRRSRGLRGYLAYGIAMATAGRLFAREGIRQNCAALIAALLATADATIPVRADLSPADIACHFDLGYDEEPSKNHLLLGCAPEEL